MQTLIASLAVVSHLQPTKPTLFLLPIPNNFLHQLPSKFAEVRRIQGVPFPPVQNSKYLNRAKMASSSQLKSDALLEQMKLHLSTDAGKEITKKIGLFYQINIAPRKLDSTRRSMLLTLRKEKLRKIGTLGISGPYEGGKPDATFSFTDEDFFKVATGKMNPQIAFMRGAIKVKGSLSAAQKFTPDIFLKPSKM
ncbi:hypothetical protein Vadar_014713 [Vaccinium darrowii]|uniref:Uncharacterized protein n=1 Tax=Vaccinium darrowii TaxID=229202 RepID=A0ACB7XQM8_9ERIC|nr:hypothetical protein Vadar_014713 [Vaccinium darrowii]